MVHRHLTVNITCLPMVFYIQHLSFHYMNIIYEIGSPCLMDTYQLFQSYIYLVFVLWKINNVYQRASTFSLKMGSVCGNLKFFKVYRQFLLQITYRKQPCTVSMHLLSLVFYHHSIIISENKMWL